MDTGQTQVVARRKTFWKMVKTMFSPSQVFANLVGCGGKSGRGKRRLSMKNMHLAKEAFIRSSFRRSYNQPPRQRRIQGTAENRDRESTVVQMHNDNDSAEPETPTSPEGTASPPLTPRVPLSLEEAETLLESLTLTASCPANAQNVDTGPESSTPHRNSPLQSLPAVIGDDSTTITEEVGDHAEPLERRTSQSDFQDRRLSAASFSRTEDHGSQVVLRRNRTSSVASSSSDGEFHGWRRSSIEVTANPPITLGYIPSGLCVGDRIVWVRDDIPEIGTVRWIGKIRNQFYSGVEFDKPVGNSSGIYGYGIGLYKRLFTCQLPYGRFVPVKELILYKDYHDTGIKSGIVCIICRDDFLDTWEPDAFYQSDDRTDSPSSESDKQPTHMVSTFCGHLYHRGCLDFWFSTKKGCDYRCPFCSSPVNRDEVIRIFPTQL